ncbi:MAG: hypothetical protein GY950_30045, partial [bacterium]|nr:hypothetical protein [bacterium]
MNHFKKFPRSSVLVLLLFLFLLHAAPLSYASRRQPFNRQLKALIEKKFYKEGVPSLEKIDRYRRAISKRRREVEQNLKNLYRLEEDLPKKEAAKKAGKKDEIRTYRILLGYIKRLKKRTAPAKEAAFQRLAAKVLALDYALKMEGKKLASVMLVEKVPASFKKRKISIRGAPQGEASNLVNPGTGLFYSQEELSRFKQQGGDVSKLNPPEDSTFWTRHPVSRIDVRKHYCEGRDALHEGLAIIFPRKKAVFKKIRKTQTKPKIDVCFRHNGKMLSFKLKIGAEVHSEVTCSALYSLLGFSVDISKYVRDFKIVLGKVSHHQFRKEWESYYSRYPLEKFIKKQGSDEEGNYIIFHEGVLEAKPKELLRVGPWAYGKNGNAGFREVRGSLIFNMWVSNLDLKEAENNKLILRKSTKSGESGDRYRFYHIQHDMGFAFGSTYIERPGSFSWKLVKKKTQHHILMNYRCFQENSLFKYVTYADARWMAQLIARLTRKQINDTLTIGGWPDSLRKLLLE